MAMWGSVGIEQLLAFGVPLSQDHLDVAEKGGQVLVMRYLPSPTCGHGYEMAQVDESGAAIMLASVAQVFPPEAEYSSHWKAGPKTMEEFVLEYYGQDYLDWASYIGTEDDMFSEVIHPMCCFMSEEPAPFRIWQTIPIPEGLDVGHEIIRATNTMLINSGWYEIADLESFYSGDDFYSEVIMFDEWPEVEDLVQPDDYLFQNWLDSHDLDEDSQSHFKRLRLGLMRLVESGHLTKDGWSGYLPIQPLRNHIEDPDVLSLWDRLVAQVTTSEMLIADSLTGHAYSLFTHQERITV